MTYPDRVTLAKTIMMLKTLVVSVIFFEYCVATFHPELNTHFVSFSIAGGATFAVIIMCAYQFFKKTSPEKKMTPVELLRNSQSLLVEDLKNLREQFSLDPQADQEIIQGLLGVRLEHLRFISDDVPLNPVAKNLLTEFINVQTKMIVNLQNLKPEDVVRKIYEVESKISQSAALERILNYQPKTTAEVKFDVESDPFFTQPLER